MSGPLVAEWQPEPTLTNGSATTPSISLDELVAQTALENGMSHASTRPP